MSSYTRNKISKVELNIPLVPQGPHGLRSETVIGMLVAALAETRLVKDITLLTSRRHNASHRNLATKLASRYHVPIRACNDRSEGESGSLPMLGEHVAGLLGKRMPVVVMCGDTLLSPSDLTRLFHWITDRKPMVGIACSHVSAREATRYGMVTFSRWGQVQRLWEKRGEGLSGVVNQGIYVFAAPYVEWGDLMPRIRLHRPGQLLARSRIAFPFSPFFCVNRFTTAAAGTATKR